MSETNALKNLRFSEPSVDQTDLDGVARVLESGWWTTGSECAAFEAELKEYLDVDHVVAVSSCTAAEEIVLAYLGLEPGSRVGVPNWTFASTALAVERIGCVPVLLDVDEHDLNLSFDALRAEVEASGLAAVVPVHFSGTPIDPRIFSYCAERSIPIVEDAAHAFGTRTDDGFIRGVGSVGACFSFYATKNLACGEGGAIATFDAGLAAFARGHRIHGMNADAINRYAPGASKRYGIEVGGIKANLPDVLAALGRTQLARFDEMQTARLSLVESYRSLLADLPLRFVPSSFDPNSANHLMVVDFLDSETRARVEEGLQSAAIPTSFHFTPLHRFGHFADKAPIGVTGLEVCERLESRLISLPLHSSMTHDDVDRVCAAVIDLVGAS